MIREILPGTHPRSQDNIILRMGRSQNREVKGREGYADIQNEEVSVIEVDGGEAIAEGQNMEVGGRDAHVDSQSGEVGGRDIGTGIQNGEGVGEMYMMI